MTSLLEGIFNQCNDLLEDAFDIDEMGNLVEKNNAKTLQIEKIFHDSYVQYMRNVLEQINLQEDNIEVDPVGASLDALSQAEKAPLEKLSPRVANTLGRTGKIAGKISPIIAAGSAGVEDYHDSHDPVHAGIVGASSGIGSWGGAEAGAGLGAMAGAPLAPFTMGASVPIGAAIGAVGGGIAGYKGGNMLGKMAADYTRGEAPAAYAAIPPRPVAYASIPPVERNIQNASQAATPPEANLRNASQPPTPSTTPPTASAKPIQTASNDE